MSKYNLTLNHVPFIEKRLGKYAVHFFNKVALLYCNKAFLKET